MEKYGVMTAELGLLVEQKISSQNLHIYYDHGDPKKDNVGEITAYYGKGLHRDNKLAEIDIAILDNQKRIILLVEVEENDDRPKTVIGDVMSTLLADGIAFRSKPCTLIEGGAALLILAKDSKVGHKDRMGEINKRVDQMLGNPVSNRLKIKRVKLALFRQPDEMSRIVLAELGQK
jgi:hypothetical protein